MKKIKLNYTKNGEAIADHLAEDFVRKNMGGKFDVSIERYLNIK
jgi:hypothetical protein